MTLPKIGGPSVGDLYNEGCIMSDLHFSTVYTQALVPDSKTTVQARVQDSNLAAGVISL